MTDLPVTPDEPLKLGPLARRAIAMGAQGRPFDAGKEPAWRDETPHWACHVTREQYPEPRRCQALVHNGQPTRCHLGHPANCRWLVDSVIASCDDYSELST